MIEHFWKCFMVAQNIKTIFTSVLHIFALENENE